MHRTIATIFAFLGMSTAAIAADYSQPLVYDWSGFYVGLQGGYALGNSTVTDTILPGGFVHARSNVDPQGYFGGLHGGFNHQFDSGLVLGLEADINASSIEGTSHNVNSQSGPRPGFVHHSELDWFGSIRGRAGFAMDRLLFYLTAGFAIGDYSLHLAHNSDISNNSDTLTGWTIGGGFQYAFSDSLSGRVEYRYTDYGSLHGTFDNFPNEALKAPLTTNDIRLGLSLKF